MKRAPRTSPKLPYRALEQQDLVDEIGRAILRTNTCFIPATLRFAQFNCTQKMRCSPVVFGEACARFGIATVKSRNHLLDLYSKRVEDHPFLSTSTYNPNATPRCFTRGAQDPTHFARKPWLDDWVACFNVCAYILRWAASVGWSKINGPIFKLWQDAASIPFTGEVVSVRSTAFYRLMNELTRGTITDAWTLPGKWVRDIFISAIADDVAPKENWKNWIIQQRELGYLLEQRYQSAVTMAARLQRVIQFCAAHSHTLDLNALVPWMTGGSTRWMRPITLALLVGDEPVVKFLIDKGVDLNLRSNTGMTPGAFFYPPLLAAADTNVLTLDGVLLLLHQPSVDLFATCTHNQTILHRLVNTLSRVGHVGHKLDKVACVLLALRKRVDFVDWGKLVRVKDETDKTALFYYDRWMAKRRRTGHTLASAIYKWLADDV